MNLLSTLPVLAILTMPVAAQAAPAGLPVNTLKEMGPALWACWRPPASVGNFQVTVVFALKRNGAVLGKPRITYATFNGNAEEQRRIMAAILDALEACTPVNVSDALGGAIAGRIFTMTFTPQTYRG
jgi:hypothetical protein